MENEDKAESSFFILHSSDDRDAHHHVVTGVGPRCDAEAAELE
jgi:hypothetical protein